MNYNQRLSFTLFSVCTAVSAGLYQQAGAINIVVDYTFDTGNFFDTTAKRDVMEAAAARFSAIINSELAPVSSSGTSSGTGAGWRVGFSHPGTGADFQLSTAADAGSDPLTGAGAAAAGGYGFAGLNANEWILFAGGRSLVSAGEGGTGTGTNFTSVFNDVNGPMNRGFDDNTPANSVGDLPRWGGRHHFRYRDELAFWSQYIFGFRPG
ncbi:MAG: hypothetical protein ACSHYB_01055 [Roseibacillus sp.]